MDKPPPYTADDSIVVKETRVGTDFTVAYRLDPNILVELRCRYNPDLRDHTHRMTARLNIETPKLTTALEFRNVTVYEKDGYMVLNDPIMGLKKLEASPALLEKLRECNFLMS